MNTPAPILTLQNDAMQLEVLADGALRLLDRGPGGRLWCTWPVAIQEDNEIDAGHVWQRTGRSLCEQYPARFLAFKAGDAVRLTVLGRENRTVGQFSARFSLDGGVLSVSIFDIDESLPSLSYPPAFAEADEIILPMGVGKRITKGSDDRKFLTFWSHLNMRMWGTLRHATQVPANSDRPDHGLLAEFARGHHDAGLLFTRKAFQPAFLKSLGRWSAEPRVMTYRFTRGGYVGLARAYRQMLASRGTLVTLAEKLSRHPQLGNLLGGRSVSFMLGKTHRHYRAVDTLLRFKPGDSEGLKVDLTYGDVKRSLESLKGAGLGKALVLIRGWIPGGYDESHPDVWPPDPAFGSEGQLRDLCGGSPELTTALHDNYQDIYLQSPSWPKGVVRGTDGRALQGGYWAGGQAYILNARDSLAYLHRNWPMLKSLGIRAFFPDTTTAVQMFQSFEPGNTITRAQDERYKLDLLKFVDGEGVLAGSEEAAEFGVPYVGWLENRHVRVAGESVPLWPLVFHDCVANGRYGNAYIGDGGSGGSGGEGAAGWRTELLWGYYILMSLGTWGESTDNVLSAIRATLHVDRFFAEVATAAMTNHEYLTSGGEVERTTFSTGHVVTVNYSDQPYAEPNLSLPPQGWKIGG